ncbi:MAG: division/cell wall cluster transcriptional repressor MraZ [Bacteroidales bacterium]|nr:division/cell wall cluster transcriptional repressor MraZ [Bacteroidales bacterium]
MFLGFETYNCKLDNKFRILVPTKFRKDNEELIREGFVIKRSLSFQCLELYPYSEWKNQVAMLNRLNPFDKRATDFKILYTAGVRTVELDGSNRILIPKELVNAGSLQKEVYLIPLGTYYQIWDKDAYEQHLAGNKGVNLNDAYSDVISELGAINDSLNNK